MDVLDTRHDNFNDTVFAAHNPSQSLDNVFTDGVATYYGVSHLSVPGLSDATVAAIKLKKDPSQIASRI